MKKIEDDKTIAFLVDCPAPGEMMMFPAWLEELDMNKFEEVTDQVTLSAKLRKNLIGTKFRIFKIK